MLVGDNQVTTNLFVVFVFCQCHGLCHDVIVVSVNTDAVPMINVLEMSGNAARPVVFVVGNSCC